MLPALPGNPHAGRGSVPLLDTRECGVVFAPPMSCPDDTVVVSAPAKINLYLNVVGVRPSGYHDIESVLTPISLSDELILERTEGLVETRVEVDQGLGDVQDLLADTRSNLAARAVWLLKEKTGSPFGVRILLRKRIPVGGGLGGGSSDAASVLLGLNRLWDLGLSRTELGGIGATLGCDVPAFVHGGAVLVEGLGEKVSNIFNGSGVHAKGRAGWWLVLVNPGFGVSTKDIYTRYGATLTSAPVPAKRMVSALLEGDLECATGALFNALEGTVLEKYPLIRVLRDRLIEDGAVGALVSGSGGSVYGLARDEAHAREIGARLSSRLECPAYVAVHRTLPDGVMAAHGPLEA
ncbi:MAG: 4-(cytidine 5'-diphospho)-2-C-methyl-D-erythritol kinase [Lentisphaerae bacterium]|nr:4-(cytidine 5'-diphospho)-2-C-methyl-D-erythritol kinase [Lentisphaerota bacterium]